MTSKTASKAASKSATLKKVVIKLGGASLQNPATLGQLAALVREYRAKNFYVVLVHGGGPAINKELVSRGIEWKFIDGQRQTTPEMIEVIDQVLAHDVNSMVVESLRTAGLHAVGMSGADDGILFCTQASEELDRVGRVERVSITAIEDVLAQDGAPTPVIAPIGGGMLGASSEKFNVNADWAATQIAIALRADKLIFLTDQNGILDQKRKLVRMATPQRIHAMIGTGVISGGMCTKVLAMMAALDSGVAQIRVLNAGSASELFQNGKLARVGTLLKADRATTGAPATTGVKHGFAS